MRCPLRSPCGRPLPASIVILHTLCLLAPVAAQPTPMILKQQRAFHDAADRAAPAVVRIQPIGGLDQVAGEVVTAGPTTGVIVSPEGHIVSSAYGVVQSPSSIVVTLADGTRTTARQVATDHSRKIVLFKIDASAPLPVAVAVPRDECRTGQWAIAIGRAATGDNVSRSIGIISAVNRKHGRAIQTDAKISPLNYGGPLIDLSGRTFGILVPMSPEGDSESAGDKWYDSGIGFAIPLADIEQRLPQLRAGHDLYRGKLGVGLPAAAPHTTQPMVVSVHPGSPAAQAGLEKGDTILTIDGVAVTTTTELRFELVPRDAGETIEIGFRRGDEESVTTATLVSELPDFQPGFVGLLLERNALAATEQNPESDAEPTSGAIIRHVYDGSPAAAAGVVAGDRLLSIDEIRIDDREAALAAVLGIAAGQTVELAWEHDGNAASSEVQTTRHPREPPLEFAAAAPPRTDYEGDRPETGEVEFELTEFPHKCLGYVPTSYRPDVPAPVLVWLHDTIDVDLPRLVNDFKPLCEQFGVILVVPRSENDRRWDATESEYVVKLLRQVATQYEVDPDRVVLGGQGAGGVLAFRIADLLPAQVRAVIAVQAAPARTMEPLSASPGRRLDLLFAVAEKARSTVRIKRIAADLLQAGIPVALLELEADQTTLSIAERTFIARWIDTLDRL